MASATARSGGVPTVLSLKRAPAEVTVVIPSRDRWQTLLTHGLASAQSQEGVELDIVVVDDGSRDDTRARVEEVGDARVHVIRSDRSAGVSVARNAGIDAASGEWIALLDDDDLWSPSKLRKQLDTAKRADASFVYSDVVHVEGGGRVLNVHRAPDPLQLRERLLTGHPIPAGSSNIVVRTELARSVGRFDPRFSAIEDFDWWIRLAQVGVAAHLETVHVAYVEHPGGRHLSFSEFVDAFDLLSQKHGQLSRELGVHLDPQPFARWVASGQLTAGRPRDGARTYLLAAKRYRRVSNLLRAADFAFGAPATRFRRRLTARWRGPGTDAETRRAVAAGELAWLGDALGRSRIVPRRSSAGIQNSRNA